jgi:hypothetical protein
MNDTKQVIDGGSVCIDCAMVIANGDTSGISDLELWEAMIGEHDPTENGKWTYVIDSGEAHFSCRRCDYCGSNLAGDRLNVTIIEN